MRANARPDDRLAQGTSDVIAWRSEQLAASGFPDVLAARLASDHRFDLHALLQLVDRGCPPELAARILAPVESAARPW
jgi:hypothetical protein